MTWNNDISRKKRKKYLLSEIPKLIGGGKRIRLGYATVDERFTLCEQDGLYFVVGTLETAGIEIGRPVYDLLRAAQQCVREVQIRYATGYDVSRLAVDEVTLPVEGTYLDADIRNGMIRITDQEIRFKNVGGDCLLNRNPSKGSAPEGDDVKISIEIFDFLWSMAKGARIEKTRFDVPQYPGQKDICTWSVDVYHGSLNARHVIAEVVLPKDDGIGVLPNIIAEIVKRDVTKDLRFRYEALAKDGFPDE